MLDKSRLIRVHTIALGGVSSVNVGGENGVINPLSPSFSDRELVTMTFLSNVLSIMATGKRCLPVDIMKDEGKVSMRFYEHKEAPFIEHSATLFAAEAWSDALRDNRFSIRVPVRSFSNLANLYQVGSMISDYGLANEAIKQGMAEMVKGYEVKAQMTLAKQPRVSA